MPPNSRREFLATLGIGLAGLSATASDEAVSSTSLPYELSQPAGEPYDLAGKRLFFQNWYYIRPGFYAWKDDAGRTLKFTDRIPNDAAHRTSIDEPFGIRLVAQQAQRMGPLIEGERPWEEGCVYLTNIFKDGGMYRGWGAPLTNDGDPPGQKHFYYLESSDGLTWKRPNLGIVELNGSRANNILNIFDTAGGTVFKDPSAPPGERYKLICNSGFPLDVCADFLRRRPGAWEEAFRGPRSCANLKRLPGIAGGVSPDGLHWTMLRDPLVVERTDFQLIAYYDQALKKYVAYSRMWVVGPRSPRLPVNRRAWDPIAKRSIARSETSDFRAFPLHETVLEPGPNLLPSETYYLCGRTAMPGAPDHHVLFPTIWNESKDITTVAVCSSHDGKIWHYLPGSPVHGPGPFGTWDGGCLMAHPDLLELPDGSFAMPYTGYSVPHKYPRPLWKFSPGYAIWPKGRLVALEAPDRGEFATVGIMPPGRTLRINALTFRSGSIYVEVAAMDGKPLPGRSFAEARPISGDHHWTPVTWDGQEDLGYKDETGIILRFRMEQAQLFGLEFA